MKLSDAIALIGAAVTREGGRWGDLGAGSGTFSRALATLLGQTGTVYAVDRDAGALGQIAGGNRDRAKRAEIRTVVGDFTEPLELPPLDGVVIANALHYVPYADQARVLRQVATLVEARAPLVVVEYERQTANQWVPYPITLAALGALAGAARLETPELLATQPSKYDGTIYSVVVRRK